MTQESNLTGGTYAGKSFLVVNLLEVHNLYEKIQSGEPFLACRFGNTELQTVVGNLKVKILGHSKEADEYLDKWFTMAGKKDPLVISIERDESIGNTSF